MHRGEATYSDGRRPDAVHIGDLRIMDVMATTTNRISEGEVLQLVHQALESGHIPRALVGRWQQRRVGSQRRTVEIDAPRVVPAAVPVRRIDLDPFLRHVILVRSGCRVALREALL